VVEGSSLPVGHDDDDFVRCRLWEIDVFDSQPCSVLDEANDATGLRALVATLSGRSSAAILPARDTTPV
jgi:hypothetical protein